VIVGNVWIGTPFNMVLLHAGLLTIPREVYEAAVLDGAGWRQRFAYVTWPLLRPVAAATMLLGIVQGIRQFDVIWILTQGGPGGATQTLSTLLYSLAFQDMSYSKGAAVGDLMMVASTLAILIYLRRVGRGVA
jgi:multiple sugar transport system permease protein